MTNSNTLIKPKKTRQVRSSLVTPVNHYYDENLVFLDVRKVMKLHSPSALAKRARPFDRRHSHAQQKAMGERLSFFKVYP